MEQEFANIRPEPEAQSVRERASIVCVHAGRMLMVQYHEPRTHRHFVGPPGGAMEPGETAVRTGERETLEETGFQVLARPESEFVSEYIYNWGGRDYHCRTHWLAGELVHPAVEPAPVQDADFIVGVEWVPVPDVAAALAYHDVVQGDVLRLLDQAFGERVDK